MTLEDHDIVGVSAPESAHVGESFEVSMTVECSSVFGCSTNTATISSGGEEFFRREDISFAANDPVTLTTTVSFDSVGDHDIQFALAGAARFRTVSVIDDPTAEPEPQPNLSVLSVNVPTHPTVGVGEEVMVTVENTGDAEGTETYSVTANGSSFASFTTTVPAGSFTNNEVTWTPQESGSVTITAGSHQGTTVDVQPAADDGGGVIDDGDGEGDSGDDGTGETGGDGAGSFLPDLSDEQVLLAGAAVATVGIGAVLMAGRGD